MERNGVLLFLEDWREHPGKTKGTFLLSLPMWRGWPPASAASAVSQHDFFGSLRLVLTLLHAVSPSPSKCKQGFNL